LGINAVPNLRLHQLSSEEAINRIIEEEDEEVLADTERRAELENVSR